MKMELEAKQRELLTIFATARQSDGTYDFLRVPGMEHCATQGDAWRVVEGLYEDEESLCRALGYQVQVDALVEQIAQRVMQLWRMS
jgi:hypothetical protein